MNKFGQPQGTRVQTQIDGVPIADLVEELRLAAVRLLRAAARQPLPRARAGVCATLQPGAPRLVVQDELPARRSAACSTARGRSREVVSPFEYDKAIAGGVPTERIHFNGPYKPDDALERAVRGGSILHIDNLEEVARIERVAGRHGAEARGRRSASTWRSKAIQIVEPVRPEPRVRASARGDRRASSRATGWTSSGLHTHIGTFILDPRAYANAARKMAELANELRAKHGVRLTFIDLGRRVRVAEHAQGPVPRWRAGEPAIFPLRRRDLRGPRGARSPGRSDADAGARDRPRVGRRRRLV